MSIAILVAGDPPAAPGPHPEPNPRRSGGAQAARAAPRTGAARGAAHSPRLGACPAAKSGPGSGGHRRTEEGLAFEGTHSGELRSPLAGLRLHARRSGRALRPTDEPFFQGSLANLEIASQSTSLPCLRKDFIVDEYQIVEARAHRADAILLIAAALTDTELARLASAAKKYALDVLCEIHTPQELLRVRALGCDAYGVNNRDLQTFEVHLETSLELAGHLPPGAVHVAESGIHTAADICRLRDAGFHAFLIGESLMREAEPGVALDQLLRAVEARTSVTPCG